MANSQNCRAISTLSSICSRWAQYEHVLLEQHLFLISDIPLPSTVPRLYRKAWATELFKSTSRCFLVDLICCQGDLLPSVGPFVMKPRVKYNTLLFIRPLIFADLIPCVLRFVLNIIIIILNIDNTWLTWCNYFWGWDCSLFVLKFWRFWMFL